MDGRVGIASKLDSRLARNRSLISMPELLSPALSMLLSIGDGSDVVDDVTDEDDRDDLLARQQSYL